MTLEELRKRIDELDTQIVRLINERARVVLEVAEAKARDGEPFYAPSREGQVYERIRRLNEGPISDICLTAVYREIISGSLALETPLKIAYLGPEGTFTHSAARAKFGDSVQYSPGSTMDDVFTDVEHGRADYGVVPVENSTGGGIHETLVRFLNSPLQVCGEIVHDIHHALLAKCPMEEIERVYSKPPVFGQTRRWLQTHLPNVELCGVTSTSVGAEQAARDHRSAAIGSASLAADHGLNILHNRIEDYSHNVTRFFVLGHHMADPTGDDKTAMLCSIADRTGALHDLLDAFKEYEINMTKIESFPSPDAAWQYYFFIDFQGHPKVAPIPDAVELMREQCEFLKILGAFPRARA